MNVELTVTELIHKFLITNHH